MYRVVSAWGLTLVEERGVLPSEKVESMRRLLAED
jgi:hypothetical protein